MEKQDEEKRSGEGKKPKGWFSRRFQTSAAHDSARSAYLVRHGQAAREQKAIERVETRSLRPTAEQLAELDRRLGAGVGAVKERARLLALVGK